MLFDDLTQRVNKGRISELRWLLWASLQAKHAQVFKTPELAGAVIDAIGRRMIQDALSELLTLNKDADPQKPTNLSGEEVKDERPGSVWRKLYLDSRPFLDTDDAFWHLSLKELWLALADGRQRHTHERDRAVTQAWWTSLLVWKGFNGKLPELNTLLQKDKAPRPERRQPWQEMKAMFTWIATAEQKPAVKGT